MDLLLSIFAADILPIFAIAGVGFLLARTLGANVKTLSVVVFYALVPCLVFNLLVTSKMTSADFGRMSLLSLLVVIAMGLVARAVAVPLRLDCLIRSTPGEPPGLSPRSTVRYGARALHAERSQDGYTRPTARNDPPTG